MIILTNKLETPLGSMHLASTDKGICLLKFIDQKQIEKELKERQKKKNLIF